jgi:mono/diheme cytochrome c family protein
MDNRSCYLWGGIMLAAMVLAGCSESNPPEFRLDMRQIVANQIVPEHQQQIADVLGAMFGTPDEPFAPPEAGLDVRKLRMAAGPVWSNQQGEKHGLYRRHCAHCHGISGDGRGPTAMILDPYPRDYRPGVFKFKSTFSADRPTDDDLRTIVYNGIPGTAMPAFALLAPDEIDALVEYVKYLSMRGQMESSLVNYVAEELDFDPMTGTTDNPLDPTSDPDQRDAIHSILEEDVVTGWADARDEVVVPVPSALPDASRSAEKIAASMEQGRELFAGTRANCIKCHGPTGLGDGQQTDQNVWEKANLQFIEDTKMLAVQIKSLKESMSKMDGEELADAQEELSQQTNELAARREVVATLLPPRNAIPRNLRQGVYRGGQRPLDLFCRIHQGIPGTPMPASGPASPGAEGTLTEEEIWHLVDYVRSLPYEPASRPQQRPVNVESVN